MLNPNDGPAKWRYDLMEGFRFNAERCRIEAKTASDPEEQGYNANLARLWEQLEIAAKYKPL